MALGHVGSFHRNLEKKIQIEAPRKPLWTWTRFCVNLATIVASLGSRTIDIFLCLRQYPGRAPTKESHGLSRSRPRRAKPK